MSETVYSKSKVYEQHTFLYNAAHYTKLDLWSK